MAMTIQGSKLEEEDMPLENHVLNETCPTFQTELKVVELSGFALQDGLGQAYHEEAFHYFLDMERKRSEASNRPFLLMLVDFKRHAGIDSSIGTVPEGKLFSILSGCLRETDFVGWYREGRVAGGVLTQHGEPDGDDLSEVVRQRVGARLEQELPPDLARDLQVRVYQLSPNVNVRSEQ